jgi:hypothetical protein
LMATVDPAIAATATVRPEDGVTAPPAESGNEYEPAIAAPSRVAS